MKSLIILLYCGLLVLSCSQKVPYEDALVPARANLETGEQFFSPNTVEKIQQIILGHSKPFRTIKTPVYEYS